MLKKHLFYKLMIGSAQIRLTSIQFCCSSIISQRTLRIKLLHIDASVPFCGKSMKFKDHGFLWGHYLCLPSLPKGISPLGCKSKTKPFPRKKHFVVSLKLLVKYVGIKPRHNIRSKAWSHLWPKNADKINISMPFYNSNCLISVILKNAVKNLVISILVFWNKLSPWNWVWRLCRWGVRLGLQRSKSQGPPGGWISGRSNRCTSLPLWSPSPRRSTHLLPGPPASCAVPT